MAIHAITINHFFINFFALLVTLLSFIVLSFQIVCITFIWMLSHFFSLITDHTYHYNKRYKQH
ncbi:MAG: hypothetical protein KAI02_06695 [Gammaproteobacteria bacterium]|nr:hypothetical protein [Gammaproteobacteria bacterium]